MALCFRKITILIMIIILRASGEKIISKDDIELVKKSGLCVIDCS